MKTSKILSAILALVMVIGCFAGISVSAETGDGTLTEVYVSKNGSTDKTASGAGTEAYPVQLHIAWQMLQKDAAGTICFLDDVEVAPYTYNLTESKTKTYTYGTTSQYEPAHTGIWTYTSKTGASGALVLNAASIHLTGPVVFDDITVKAWTAPSVGGSAVPYTHNSTTMGEINIFCRGNDVTFTENFEVGCYVLDSLTSTNNDKAPANYATTTAKLNVVVGADSSGFEVSDDFVINMNAGTFNKVIAGIGQKGGTFDGDVNVIVNSGVTVAELILAQVYTGSSTYADGVMNGDTNIILNNATLNKLTVSTTKNTTPKHNQIYNGNVIIKMVGDVTMPTTYQYDTKFFARTDSPDTAVDKDGNAHTGCYIWYKNGIVLDASGYTGDDVAAIDSAFLYIRTMGCDVTVTDAIATGMQSSTPASNKANVRFLVGLRSHEHVQASFKVVAKWTDNGGQQKIFTKDAVHAYSSVLADVNGVNTTVTAADEGANFLIALTIKDVPTDKGAITFEVTPVIGGIDGVTSTFEYIPS